MTININMNLKIFAMKNAHQTLFPQVIIIIYAKKKKKMKTNVK